MRDDVDEILQAVLGRDRGDHGKHNGRKHDRVADGVASHVMQEKTDWPHAGEVRAGGGVCRRIEQLGASKCLGCPFGVFPCVVAVQLSL